MKKKTIIGPASDKDALSLYNPEAYIPISRNERRLMAKATRHDMAAWQAIDEADKSLDRRSLDWGNAFRASILATWRPEEKTLADVMARIEREKKTGGAA
jgi:hypothetical protein